MKAVHCQCMYKYSVYIYMYMSMKSILYLKSRTFVQGFRTVSHLLHLKLCWRHSLLLVWSFLWLGLLPPFSPCFCSSEFSSELVTWSCFVHSQIWHLNFLLHRKLRERDATIFHIQLCIALFCMLLVFVSGIDQAAIYGGCVLVSVLIHYFTLVAVMFMGAEAVLMFHKLVLVFRKTTTKFFVTVSLVCWCKCIYIKLLCSPRYEMCQCLTTQVTLGLTTFLLLFHQWYPSFLW